MSQVSPNKLQQMITDASGNVHMAIGPRSDDCKIKRMLTWPRMYVSFHVASISILVRLDL